MDGGRLYFIHYTPPIIFTINWAHGFIRLKQHLDVGVWLFDDCSPFKTKSSHRGLKPTVRGDEKPACSSSSPFLLYGRHITKVLRVFVWAGKRGLFSPEHKFRSWLYFLPSLTRPFLFRFEVCVGVSHSPAPSFNSPTLNFLVQRPHFLGLDTLQPTSTIKVPAELDFRVPKALLQL